MKNEPEKLPAKKRGRGNLKEGVGDNKKHEQMPEDLITPENVRGLKKALKGVFVGNADRVRVQLKFLNIGLNTCIY